MEFNLIGIAAGITTFFGVWIGHVLVRKLESNSESLTLPAVGFALIGFLLEIGSFLSDSTLISACLGILGVTALWDVVELFRQQKRIIKGRAPANPSNPRHARILEQHPSATTLDLLKRDPLRRMVKDEEAAKLVVEKGEMQ